MASDAITTTKNNKSAPRVPREVSTTTREVSDVSADTATPPTQSSLPDSYTSSLTTQLFLNPLPISHSSKNKEVLRQALQLERVTYSQADRNAVCWNWNNVNVHAKILASCRSQCMSSVLILTISRKRLASVATPSPGGLRSLGFSLLLVIRRQPRRKREPAHPACDRGSVSVGPARDTHLRTTRDRCENTMNQQSFGVDSQSGSCNQAPSLVEFAFTLTRAPRERAL